ncbi:DUF167 domain-containing protein [Microcella sp.]|uniref:DUF167 domain-containing protein n=1 Tax=Microcella sp. TaxID=1913979 RepID=UPI00299F82CE|nr:DUF167 domain-containing protein [Microcella sp.]MDX2025224.1 DUF167 domain-containing protein [Microcella sp.]
MPRTLRIRVKPGSRRGPLVETGDDGLLVVVVRERAVDGAANSAVERVLAEHLGLAPSRVTITRGQGSRIKTVVVDD